MQFFLYILLPLSSAGMAATWILPSLASKTLSYFYSDRFSFSYAKDGKLRMEIKSAVPTDAGVYKCTVWGKKAGTARTKARMLVGGE